MSSSLRETNQKYPFLTGKNVLQQQYKIMFERFKITVKDLEALRNKYPKPRFTLNPNKSQEFYARILETCTHDGVIDGSDLSNLNFPFDNDEKSPKHYDVFISYSHNDEQYARYLYWFLTSQCKLSVFLDSTIWHSADALLKVIDDAYCKNVDNRTYNYRKRNYSTSHVHTLLSMAMLTAIERSECFIFIESENSTTLKDGLSDCSLSPWIYQESMFADVLPRVKPSRFDGSLRMITKSFALVDSLKEGKKLMIRHKLRTMDFHSIYVEDLDMMKYITGLRGMDCLYLRKGIVEPIK